MYWLTIMYSKPEAWTVGTQGWQRGYERDEEPWKFRGDLG